MTRQRGQTLVELLVAIGLTAIMMPALVTAIFASREGRAQEAERLQAAALLRETDEAVRSVREKGWAQFAVNGTFYPSVSANSWSLTAGTETVGNFIRQVAIADVQRNASGAIVPSGGTVDQSTKKVTTTVSWTTQLPSSVSNETYYQRYVGNAAWAQTTQAEFTAGTETNTVATATGGGQVELTSGGGGISHVQTAASTNEASATTIAQAFPAAVNGGNLIVVAVSWDTASSTTVTCSDNQNNTYATAINTNDATNTQAQAICYALNASGGSTTVTATFGAASVSRRIIVHEYSGVATTAPVDITRGQAANGTTATDNITSTAGTTTTAGDLIFGAVVETAAGTSSITAGTGFTQRNTVAADTTMATQDRIQAATGSIASTQTFNAAQRYVAQMVAFKPLGSPAAWAPPNRVSSADNAGTEDSADVFTSGNFAYSADATVLRIYDISNPAVPTLTGSYTAAGTINGVYVSGNFAYLATGADTAELTIVNISNPASPTLTANFDLAGTTDATAVFVSGTAAHLTKVLSTTSGQNEYFNVNITTPASPSLTGSFNLSAAANSVCVNGNFAYLATSITTAELTIIDNTAPASPTQAGVYEAVGTSVGNDVHCVGTTVYLAKANNTSGAELFILNAATPSSVTLVGSHETGANINGVFVSGTTAFLATAITNAQFRVLNIATPSSPTTLGSLNMAAVSNDVMFSGSYAYVASASDTRELALLQQSPATGGGGFQTSGTFDSSSFDAGASAAFNYITFTVTEPASTNIRFQVATNNDNATWNYAGPDGTAATYYDSPQSIRLNTVGRYLRYRATFSGPGTSTPALSDISINYSP
jgi:type II secretory pathway pseudopilin PulG